MLPRILVVDDLFGRALPDARNENRADLCAILRLVDVTGDEVGKGTPQRIHQPIAEVVFCRGQTPACAHAGDCVENDLEGILDLVASGWERLRAGAPPWALVLLDLCFYTGIVADQNGSQRGPGIPLGRDSDDDPRQYFGLQILGGIHERFPDLPVVILSSKPRTDVEREFTSLGALDFLPRPSGPSASDELRSVMRQHALLPDESGMIVGTSRRLLLAVRAARRAAENKASVLIFGESGSGKEMTARQIHNASSRRDKPFIAINCAALPETLLESELFGHAKGAFTGATADKKGLFELADGGTLFLDEVGDMSPGMQAKLLRALATEEITPVGKSRPVHVDVRVIAATNKNLKTALASGEFREDLYFRLEQTTIALPPLRERFSDLPMLVDSFVRNAEREIGATVPREIPKETIDAISRMRWPGNVRQLRHRIEKAVREHPNLRVLAPLHLADTHESNGTEDGLILPLTPQPVPSEKQFRLDQITSREIHGALPALQQECATKIADLLEEALKETLKKSVKNPKGKIQPLAAMRIATGNELTGAAAADVYKRLLKLLPIDCDAVFGTHPLLKQALEWAVRLRKSKGNQAVSISDAEGSPRSP